MKFKRTSVFALLLLFGAAGCADLDVVNPNQPPRDVVAPEGDPNPTDLESLISGGFRTWWQTQGNPDGPFLFLSTAGFEHSATAANFNMVDRSWMPRTQFPNFPGDAQTGAKILWDGMYRAIAAVNDGQTGLGNQLIEADANRTTRAHAYGAFVQAMAYATLAQSFDQAAILPDGFIYDQDRSPAEQFPAPVGYAQVREHAFGLFQKAIDLATAPGVSFTVPATWMSVEVSNTRLAQLAHSYRARFRAETLRPTLEDVNAAAIWNAVIADIDAGIQDDWVMAMSNPVWTIFSVYYPNAFWGAWGKVPYTLYGMADQSGRYQQWMATMPWLVRTPFLIETPDLRFPQGSTAAEQAVNDGVYILYWPGGQANQERGVWRHSHYVDDRWWGRSQAGFSGPHPTLTQREMRLLKAEAHYRLGQYAQAADLVNVTRVGTGGLSATDAAGANASCVPKLPNGACGGLLEMLKWEKRLETYHERFGGFYWDSRRWGDLAEGSFVHMPIPLAELTALGMAIYTHGGTAGDFTPLGTYGY
jgi:hypothetical protein